VIVKAVVESESHLPVRRSPLGEHFHYASEGNHVQGRLDITKLSLENICRVRFPSYAM
jgi:hypothetical protein